MYKMENLHKSLSLQVSKCLHQERQAFQLLFSQLLMARVATSLPVRPRQSCGLRECPFQVQPPLQMCPCSASIQGVMQALCDRCVSQQHAREGY